MVKKTQDIEGTFINNQRVLPKIPDLNDTPPPDDDELPSLTSNSFSDVITESYENNERKLLQLFNSPIKKRTLKNPHLSEDELPLLTSNSVIGVKTKSCEKNKRKLSPPKKRTLKIVEPISSFMTMIAKERREDWLTLQLRDDDSRISSMEEASMSRTKDKGKKRKKISNIGDNRLTQQLEVDNIGISSTGEASTSGTKDKGKKRKKISNTGDNQLTLQLGVGNIEISSTGEASTSRAKDKGKKKKKISNIGDNQLTLQLEVGNIGISSTGEAITSGTKKSRTRKKILKIGLIVDMPMMIRESIHAIGGYDIKLVIQKVLTDTDVSKDHSRLSLPPDKLIAKSFLTTEEETFLRYNKNDKKKKGMTVRIFDSELQESFISFKQWQIGSNEKKLSYCLMTQWNSFVKRTKLKSEDEIQLWCFRIGQNDGVIDNSNLCFIMIKLPMPNREEQGLKIGESSAKG